MSIAQFPIPAATGDKKTGFTSQQLNQPTSTNLGAGIYQVETTSELNLSGPSESYTIPAGATQEIVTADGLNNISFTASAYPSEFIVQKQTQLRGYSPICITSDGVSKIVAGTNGGELIYSGDGGVNWQIIDGVFSSNNFSTRAAAFGSDGAGGPMFVVGGDSNEGAYSSDGLTWTQFGSFNNATNSDTYAITYSEELSLWISATDDEAGYSSNGQNWTPGSSGIQSTFYGIRAIASGMYQGAPRVVLAGSSGRTAISNTGTSWSTQGTQRMNSGSNGEIRNVEYVGDETFIASDSASWIGISYNGGSSYSSFDADSGTPGFHSSTVVNGVPYLSSGSRMRANKTMVRNEQAWDLFGPVTTNITTSLYPEDFPFSIICLSNFQGRLLYGISGGFMWSDQFGTNRAVLTQLSDLAFKVDG